MSNTPTSASWLIAAVALPTLALAADGGPDGRDIADELVVVGSRTDARSALDASVPVEVYDAARLRASGAAGNELGEALAAISPTFTFPRQSNSVTSDHVRAGQLRGMSPDQMLVLVNGQRRHPAAVVNDNTKVGRGTNAFDFNSIPLSAIRRVEILRDGASAQYGADAVAGVINIVLEDGADGGEVGATWGAHRTRVGPIDERVTDGQTLTLHGQAGMPIGAGGFLRGGAEYATRSTTNRAGLDRVPSSGIVPPTDANLALDGSRTHRVGDPDSDEYKLWFNTALPLGAAEFYGFGTFAQRETEGADVFRHPDSNQNVRELFPGGFLPVTLGDNRDLGLTAGVRRDAGGWGLDLALDFGRNRFDFGVENSLNASLGPDSPTRFDSGRFSLNQLNATLEASRELMLPGLVAPARLSLGADVRHERFESQPGDEDSFAIGDFRFDPALEALVGLPDIGSQAAKGLSPEDATRVRRDVAGAWINLAMQPTDDLEFDVAGRIERYSDFGTAFAGKLSTRYTVTEQVALRGSVSNSFRPPSVSQLGWARRDNTFGPDAERVSSRLVRADSAIGTALGLQALEEETSIGLTAGAVLRLTPSLSATIDAFRIEVDDRITLSENLQDPGLIELVQTLPGGEGVQSISTFTNAVDTRTEGVELAVDHGRRAGGGDLDLGFAWSWVRTRITGEADAPEALAAFGDALSLVGVAERNTLQEASPRNRGIAHARWSDGDWRLRGRVSHYGSVVREFSFARQRFGAETTVDVEIGRRLFGDTWATVGADNVFDALPDASAGANNFFGNFAFDPISPIGINGRFVWGRVTSRF